MLLTTSYSWECKSSILECETHIKIRQFFNCNRLDLCAAKITCTVRAMWTSEKTITANFEFSSGYELGSPGHWMLEAYQSYVLTVLVCTNILQNHPTSMSSYFLSQSQRDVCDKTVTVQPPVAHDHTTFVSRRQIALVYSFAKPEESF